MTIDEKLAAIRDIIQVDIAERGLARDPRQNLINACPNDFANACRSLGEHPNPRVVILTGFWIADANPPCGETDGPLGAVFLARSLSHMQIQATILTDLFCAKAIAVGLNSCGLLQITNYCWTSASVFPAAGLSAFSPSDRGRLIDIRTVPPASHQWNAYLEVDWGHIDLTHFVSLERVGPASDGRCYSMRGRDITDNMNPAHLIVEHLSRHDVTTIGIGDGGNEIGMGKIPVETIESNIPNGRQIACRVPTDHLIVAGISNWGAYALAAGLALVRGQQLEGLFDPSRERAILAAMVEQGPLVDGRTAQPTATVDGIAFEEYISTLTKIRKIVEKSV